MPAGVVTVGMVTGIGAPATLAFALASFRGAITNNKLCLYLARALSPEVFIRLMFDRSFITVKGDRIRFFLKTDGAVARLGKMFNLAVSFCAANDRSIGQ